MSEPVEYQYRTRPDWIAEWNGWNTCSKESAEAYEKNPYLHDWHYEVRALYTSPPAQEFTCSTGLCHYRKPLTDEQVSAIWKAVPNQALYEAVMVFARAIEAAHGIKGDA